MGATRFQRYVKRRAGNPMALGVSVAERLNFGVRLPRAVMPASGVSALCLRLVQARTSAEIVADDGGGDGGVE